MLTRLFTFLFLLNALFFPMGEVCLCTVSESPAQSEQYLEQGVGLSHHEKNVQQLDGHPHANQISDTQSLNPDNCCADSQCDDQCMCNPALSTVQKQVSLVIVDTNYPPHMVTHYYQIYLSVSSPPPVI
jgi:hypothetical protein